MRLDRTPGLGITVTIGAKPVIDRKNKRVRIDLTPSNTSLIVDKNGVHE
jgi:hypothetical protein